MITLRPVTPSDAHLFRGTEYDSATEEEIRTLIAESQYRLHNGKYFEFLIAFNDGEPVGFMNLYAHSAHIISCGPEIFLSHRRKGLAFAAEQKALDFARSLGYTVAVANVREDNLASRALHEKLGFELERTYIGRNNTPMLLYIRAL